MKPLIRPLRKIFKRRINYQRLLAAWPLFFYFLLPSKSFAISYENETTVCAEVTVQDKTTHNCFGSAEFKEISPNKYALKVVFKVADFEIEDIKTKEKYEGQLKQNDQKEIIFQTPAFEGSLWTKKLQDVFRLFDTNLILGDDKIELENVMLLKKKVGNYVSYQIDAVVPLNKATFIHPPKGLKRTKTFHLKLIVPQSEIKGIKF